MRTRLIKAILKRNGLGNSAYFMQLAFLR